MRDSTRPMEMTFNTAFPANAFCSVTPKQSMGGASYYISALSAAGSTVTFSGAAGGDVMEYVCGGN